MKDFVYSHQGIFKLESGKTLPDLNISYSTIGELNEQKNNVIWVFHALSANSSVTEWWPGLFGEGKLYDPSDYFIICANAIGSPYGASKPSSLQFPHFSVRDIVNAHLVLADHLHIQHIHTAIGGSFGGNQALEFAYLFSGNLDHLILMASSSRETAWGIAVHESQRIALSADPTFGTPDGGKAGLKAARTQALLMYRTPDLFENQQRDLDDRQDDFSAASYIQYQGDKFVDRFDALSYYYLSKCMDTHHIGRDRGGEEKALEAITIPTLVIGISSDSLVPVEFQRFLAEQLPHAHFTEIDSVYGHDGFLIETEVIGGRIQDFYAKVKEQSSI